MAEVAVDTAEGPSVREWLRGLPVFAGPLPDFDPADAPAEPVALFLTWLRQAVEAGLPDPHAVTLSTVDEEGCPDARVLILKHVDAHGWQFAAHAASPKGRQLSSCPRAALTFYWPAFGRQVRVRGAVAPEPPEASAADLLARSSTARAEALLGRQSNHLTSTDELDQAFRAARARIEAEPALVSPEWTLYTLAASAVEFWQADRSRIHTRLRYEHRDPQAPWERHLLWP